MEQLKVSTKSNPNSVAGAMAGVLRQEGVVEVQVVGAGALNQAIKAVAIARGYVAPAGPTSFACPPSPTTRSTASGAPPPAPSLKTARPADPARTEGHTSEPP